MRRIALCVILSILFVLSCTYEKKGLIVKDVKGNIYRLDPTNRVNETYIMTPVDTAIYNKLFQ